MIKINLLSEGKRAVRKAKPAASLLEGKDVGQYLIVLGLVVLLGIAAAIATIRPSTS